MKVSQLKAQLQTIITNISRLENIETGIQADVSEQTQQLCRETHALLDQVEKQSNRSMLRSLKKRKLRRSHKNKSKQRNKKATASRPEKSFKKDKSCSAAASFSVGEPLSFAKPVPPHTNQNEFQQLRNYQQAQRYLRSFELLEMLHFARTQDKQQTQQFHEKLAHLRSFWNNVLIENRPKRTQERRIEDLWNEVIFGANEQTFYASVGHKTERQRQREFLNIRQTWDSFLVRNKKQGSNIPLGWVLPKNQVSEAWEQYKIP